MERPTGAKLRIRRQANKTLRTVHNKTTKPETSPGWTPPSESFLTACRQGNAAAPKNLENVKVPSVPLDRGCLSRQKTIDPLFFSELVLQL